MTFHLNDYPPEKQNEIIQTFLAKSGIVNESSARDEDGKRIKVPADMTYRDWKA